ncbi:MAG TPA: hypothetical protein DCP28_38395, partial [Cytophagales bacterium]|nr:hypothetical protein [Cytophagales bacterium]
MANHIVTLTQNLKGFAGPDPNAYVAEVPAGEYPLFQIMSQYPNPDTDFVQLDLPDTDEDLWICIRWKDQVYATMRTEQAESARPPINFHSEIDLSQAQGPVFHGGAVAAPTAEEPPMPEVPEEQLQVQQALKGFMQPATRSTQAGVVQPGTYPILEVMENHPSDNTDFVCIAHPSAPEEGIWLCVRWKKQTYATIVSSGPEAPPAHNTPAASPTAGEGQDAYASDPMAIAEEALTSLLPSFHPFGYDLHKGYYPYALPGV